MKQGISLGLFELVRHRAEEKTALLCLLACQQKLSKRLAGVIVCQAETATIWLETPNSAFG